MPATVDPSATAPVRIRAGKTSAMLGSLLPVAGSERDLGALTAYGGGPGGGGASSGLVIGGRPGISTTCDPAGGGTGAPSGGGGGAGGTPLLIWIVIIEPGIVWPLGVVPTTSPYLALLLTELVWSETWKPASLRRWRAAS